MTKCFFCLSLAVEYLFLTNDGQDGAHELVFEPFNARDALNDYEVWILEFVILHVLNCNFNHASHRYLGLSGISSLTNALYIFSPKSSQNYAMLLVTGILGHQSCAISSVS